MIPLTEIEKKLFSIVSTSFDGYLRLFKIRETKNLEIVAQCNLMDKILHMIPLELNRIGDHQRVDETVIPERKFAIVTQRGGILVVSSCEELEQRSQQAMIELFSRNLPHRGCLTPMHAHITPTTVFPEKNSIKARTNQNTIDYNLSLY